MQYDPILLSWDVLLERVHLRDLWFVLVLRREGLLLE